MESDHLAGSKIGPKAVRKRAPAPECPKCGNSDYQNIDGHGWVCWACGYNGEAG